MKLTSSEREKGEKKYPLLNEIVDLVVNRLGISCLSSYLTQKKQLPKVREKKSFFQIICRVVSHHTVNYLQIQILLLQ